MANTMNYRICTFCARTQDVVYTTRFSLATKEDETFQYTIWESVNNMNYMYIQLVLHDVLQCVNTCNALSLSVHTYTSIKIK